MEEDWELIEASFVTQYGIRLTETEMDWKEFITLLSAIMPETPLGKIVQIRAEEDREILKHFTPEQRSIRDSWRNRHSTFKDMSEKEKQETVMKLQESLAVAFG